MTEPGGLGRAVERSVLRHGRGHVGLVVGAVTSAGERAVVPVGRLRAPDGPTPRADSLFEIGSVTKVFTALLLAEAVTRGELALQTPLADVLPEVQVPTRDGVAITLEHLATHTAGLPRNPVPLPAALLAQWRARDGDPWEAVDRAGLLAALAGTTLRRTPGTGRIAYSNLGAGVLGHALVAAAGSRDFGELVRARVCGPLGMADTVLVPDRRQARARGRRPPSAPPAHRPLAGRRPARRRRAALHRHRRADLPAGPAAARTPVRSGRPSPSPTRSAARAGGSGSGWAGCGCRCSATTSCSGTTAAPAASAPSPGSCRPQAWARSRSPTTGTASTGSASTCSPRSPGSWRRSRPSGGRQEPAARSDPRRPGGTP